MSSAIWKYDVSVHPMRIMMPHGATILSVQPQVGLARMWVLVDQKSELEPRYFRTYGTGHELPAEAGVYIGTYQLDAGEFVGHLFEVKL